MFTLVRNKEMILLNSGQQVAHNLPSSGYAFLARYMFSKRLSPTVLLKVSLAFSTLSAISRINLILSFSSHGEFGSVSQLDRSIGLGGGSAAEAGGHGEDSRNLPKFSQCLLSVLDQHAG